MNVRWASVARERTDQPYLEADAAYDESLRRIAPAKALAAQPVRN